MDGIANVARQQQNQMQTQEANSNQAQTARAVKPQNVVKELQKEVSSNETKINSKEEMNQLVDKLNRAMGPMNTNISFGVDKDDIFYVSVMEADSKRLIRRFPAEQAMDFLPKMQEVTGILFDTKG